MACLFLLMLGGMSWSACRQQPVETAVLQQPATLDRKLERRFPVGTPLANVSKWMFNEAFELEEWTPTVVTYTRTDQILIDQQVTYRIYVRHENGFVEGFEVERSDVPYGG
ncbi:MAG: hypothetical protein E1N59_2425 [Puniceicoccaceae bacterium 5H]|nr:MAG: hypothetical protein E1N59_2425 [Puniceicoccaceae bacterium 5H]